MWENKTNYQRGEERTEIRTTRIDVDGLCITVSKYIDYGSELVMHCHSLGIKEKPLNETDMGKGQQKAIRIVKLRAEKILYAIEQI
jgi:hypothetical protein